MISGANNIDSMPSLAVEKSFRYLFKEGVLKCSFTSNPELRIQSTIFKQTNVADEKKVYLTEFQDNCNTKGFVVLCYLSHSLLLSHEVRITDICIFY